MPFKPGESGNPKGRPKGARSKFSEKFIKDFAADWEEHGIDAIIQMRIEKPDIYVRVAAGLVPKDYNVNVNDERSISDYSLAELLAIRDRLKDSGDDRCEGEPTSVH